MTNDPTKWVTIPQAADILGISVRTARRYVADGTLESKMENGRRYVAVTNDTGNDTPYDTLLAEKNEQIDWLRQRVEALENELSEVRQRSDSIIMQLSRQFEKQQLMLEDMSQQKTKRRWWGFFGWWKEPAPLKDQ